MVGHRPAKDPVVEMHNTRYEKQERAMDRLSIASTNSTGRTDPANLKKHERAVNLVRESRRNKDTDDNNNEIHATEAVMRKTFARHCAGRQAVRERASREKAYETRRLRTPAKHGNATTPGIDEKSNRSSRESRWVGTTVGPKSPNPSITLAAGARTERPREYTQQRGGQGQRAQCKAVVRLNRLYTVPGMTVSRAPEQKFRDGKVITQHDRRIMARKNHRSLSKQIQRDQFKSTFWNVEAHRKHEPHGRQESKRLPGPKLSRRRQTNLYRSL